MISFSKVTNLGVRHAWLWRYRRSLKDRAADHRPRLLVDVSAIIRHDAQTGIQRVVRAVWSELQRRSDIGMDILPVYATSAQGYCYAPFDFLEREAGTDEQIAVRLMVGDRFLGLDLSAHLLPKYRRQVRAWRTSGATVHLLVYDLLPLQRPGWFTNSAVSHFRKWVNFLATEADQALCISDQVFRELSHYLGSPKSKATLKIGRVRLGADMGASLPSTGISVGVERIVERMRVCSAILMVGTVEPRKGYEAALAAFDHLWRNRRDAPDLIIAGKSGWMTEELQAAIRSHPEFGNRLHWFDKASDEELCLLYDACRGVLVASRGEGWGLPVVEAAMHRRYVLARNLPVFREHGLPNIVYFDDDAPTTLAEELSKLVAIGRNPAPFADLPKWADCVQGILNELGLANPDQRQPELRQMAS